MMLPPEFSSDDILPQATCNLQVLQGALPCDAWHHYYHYQSSAQYLWLAETCVALGQHEDALAAYTKAIFQDHFNEEALAGKKGLARQQAKLPVYDKHPLYDLEFRGLIGQLPDDATKPHDEAVTEMLAGDHVKAFSLLRTAIATAPHHSNSYFARGKYYFLQARHKEALADFMQAIRLSHLAHDAYHKAASAEHVARGREFLQSGQLDLAISDFTKALDLYSNNKEARAARANAYRIKGNVKLALEDEKRLI